MARPWYTTETDTSSGNSAAAAAYYASGNTPDEVSHNAAIEAIKAYYRGQRAARNADHIRAFGADNGDSYSRVADLTMHGLQDLVGQGSGKGILDIFDKYKDQIGSFAGSVGEVLDRFVNGDSPSGGSPGGGVPRGSYGSYQDVIDLVNQTAMDNNEWSAYQAQLDRDWQEYMSNTAHTREVQDLKNAGLNPVLSAGGTGASTPSGAMGQTDTSNTRLVAELATAALEIAGQSAAAVGNVAKSGILSRILSSKGAQYFGRGMASAAGRALVYSLFRR